MPLDREDTLKMLELSAMGYSGAAIARRFGVTPQYVSAILSSEVERAKDRRTAQRKVARKYAARRRGLPEVVDVTASAEPESEPENS